MIHVSLRLPRYFQKPLGRQLSALYTFIAMQDFALAMMILFEPVFLYREGFTIASIALFYAAVYVLYIFLIPLGGKFVGRFGPTRAISLSTVFLVAYYVSFIFIPAAPVLIWIAPVLFACQKSLFWPGFHVDFIRTSQSGERGREFSGIYSISTLMYIIGPAIGGLIITWLGYPTLFIVGAAIIFCASLPLLSVPVEPIRETRSYRQLFVLPWRRQHRRNTLSYFGFGESMLHMYIWPIYLSISFATIEKLGGLATLASLITAVITLGVGRMFDKGHWRLPQRVGAGLAALTWLTRPWLKSVPSVFGSAVAGQISQNLEWVTASDVAYERALKENDDIGRSIMLEQGLSYGKALAGILLAILAISLPPFSVAFGLGAGFALLYFLFR